MSNILTRDDVIIGVDTHKKQHVAVAIDGLGSVIDSKTITADPDGYADLYDWTGSLGKVHAFGIEGCGSYGQGLCRFIRRHDMKVHEVSRPPRKGVRRLAGKDDAIDAEHAARTVLSGEGLSVPKTSDGPIEAIRLLKIVRDTAIKAHTTTMITLKTVVVTAPDELRSELEPLTDHKLVLACAELESKGDIADPNVAIRHSLKSLADRYLELHEEIKTHTKHLKDLTKQSAPELIERFGIGFDSASEMLITIGDNNNRIKSEAAFAKLCGACPIPAGSGQSNGRHRLNRGGNRQANASLHRIAVVRMRFHEPTIEYVKRRTKEGLTKKDIIRCLKRYIAREIYQLITNHQKIVTQTT